MNTNLIKERFKRLFYIILVSLILLFINENLWSYNGKEFWIYYSIIFGITFVLVLIVFIMITCD